MLKNISVYIFIFSITDCEYILYVILNSLFLVFRNTIFNIEFNGLVFVELFRIHIEKFKCMRYITCLKLLY